MDAAAQACQYAKRHWSANLFIKYYHQESKMTQAIIQLYSLATPNGVKASIALEEMGLDYDAHKINIMEGDQFTPEFIKLNPNSKIPAIQDPNGPNGKAIDIMESGAILIYLAQKTGKLLPTDPHQHSQVLQWLFFQVGHIGPMFGQFGHFFRYATEQCDHPYPVERYTNETKRLLEVLDKKLQGQDFIANNQYSIADIAIFPWVNCLTEFYEAGDALNMNRFKNVNRWLTTCLERPAVKKGMKVCGFD